MVDQRAVVTVVKEYRKGTRDKKRAIEEEIKSIFQPLILSKDFVGRRTYYGIWLFGECEMETTLPLLLTASNHPQSAVRNMVAEAIGKITSKNQCLIDKKVLSELGNLLSDSYYRTRVHAAESIGKIGAISLLPSLKDAIEREPLLSVQSEMMKAEASLEKEKTN